MWGFSEANKYFISSIIHCKNIIMGLNVYSKDFFEEINELFSSSGPKSVTNGINDILLGYSISVWVSMFANLISNVLNGSFNLFSSLISCGISYLITMFILQVMYNHRMGWNGLIIKIYCVFILANIVFSIFGLFGNLFSFSLLGVILIIAKIISILCYSLILKGLLTY